MAQQQQLMRRGLATATPYLCQSACLRTAGVCRAWRSSSAQHARTTILLAPPPSSSRLTMTPSRSRGACVRSFEGDASKSLKEAAALDELIDMLLAAKSSQELSTLVAQNVLAFDAKFWLRIATRSDSAPKSGSGSKDALAALANSVMTLVDAMVTKADATLSDSAKVLQEILTAAADERGEWFLPLAPEQVAALRAALDARAEQVDEALLSNVFAWMRKCQEDGFDSMVALLQKVLQLYAARALRGAERAGAEGAVNDVVWAEEGEWERVVRGAAAGGAVTEAEFMAALQRKMEAAVLGLQSGSYAQRVQAEYLKEVEARAKGAFKALAEEEDAGAA